MNANNFDSFLYIGNLGIKFSLIVLIVYLAISAFVLREKKSVREWQLEKRESGCDGRQIRKIIVTLLAFSLALPLYLTHPATVAESLAASVCAVILRWETLLSCGLFMVFLCGIILIQKNKRRFIRTVNSAVRLLLPACTFATMATRQIELSRYLNWLCLLVLGVAFVVLWVYEIEPKTALDMKSYYFAPIEAYEELFPERQRQADRLVALIQDSPADAYSICVNGQWGFGKTSVVNGALNKLKKDYPGQYEEIRINAMEMDTTQSLLSYVFDQIKRCIQKRGAYVGLGSEYRDVLASIMKTAGGDSAATWFEKLLFPSSEDYRTQKKQLEEIIRNSMGSGGKIIIVVDDIERCDEEKAKQFIFFTKEVATMARCVVIFIADYDYLEKCLPTPGNSAHEEVVEYHFYEKFFNYRIDLPAVSIVDALETLDKGETHLNKEFEYDGFQSPSNVFVTIEWEFDEAIRHTDSGEEGQQKLRELSANRERFKETLASPRRLTKLLITMREYYKTINRELVEPSTDRWPEIECYFRSISLEKTVFLVSYIKTCFPTEGKQLEMQGAQYFDAYVGNTLEDSGKQCIAELIKGHFIEGPAWSRDWGSTYRSQKARRFVDFLLKYPEELSQIVNTFTRQEEEWLAAVDQKDSSALERDWTQIFETVLEAAGDRDAGPREDRLQKGHRRMRFLLEVAKGKILSGSWNGDTALFFLDTSRHNRWWLENDLSIMKDIYDVMGEDDVVKLLGSNVDMWLRSGFGTYSYFRMRPIYYLLYYFTADASPDREEEGRMLEKAYEHLLITDKKNGVEDGLRIFLNRLEELTNIPKEYQEGKTVFEKLRILRGEIETFLREHGVPNDEIILNMEQMEDVIQDMEYYTKFQNAVRQETTIVRDIDGLAEGNMEKVISDIRELLATDDRNKSRMIQTRLAPLFEQIGGDSIELSDEQIGQLHELITQLYANTYLNPIYYHRTLIQYQTRKARRQEQGNSSAP